MNVAPNGHGRAASDSSRPQVRMGITMLEPRDWTYDEIIEDTKEGILCEDFKYGYTDPSTGNFQFKCKNCNSPDISEISGRELLISYLEVE